MNGFNHLVRRNRVYYIRVRIPQNLKHLTKSSEFRYSLKTHSYYAAIEKLAKESYKINLKINFLKGVDMRIKKGELILSDEEIDKLVIHKLKMIEDIFENHYEEVASNQFDISSMTFFKSDETSLSKSDEREKELDSIEIFIKEYFKDLKSDKRTHNSIIKEIGRIEKSDIQIISNRLKPAEWVTKTRTAFRGVDKYIIDKADCIEQDIDFNRSINPRVKRCLNALDEQKNQKALSAGTQTPWTKIFKEFATHKNNHKGTKSNTINQNKMCLETIFEIIGKEYIENITYRDCQKVCDNIYNVPKKWREKYKNKTISEVLEQNNDDKISITSVKKYLRAFKEFMFFCKQRRYIPESFNDDVLIPKRKTNNKIDGFTNDELKMIFNPSFYPKKHNIYHPCRYWVPLIALYTGMRLNEICQLYLDDIKYENRVWYISITDTHDNQHIKNEQSRRNVPIHPKLIEMGFIEYIREVRKNKKERVFETLKYSKKNHFANAVSGWFARYMTEIKVKQPNKVFHSFRHTVKPHLRDAGIAQEYQNAICGWSGTDIGELVYGGQIPIKKLYEEISKLQYPFLDKNLKEIKKLNEQH